MSYNELGIINLALVKVGAKRITSADWATPVTQQSLDATAVWEYIRDEVLEAKDWRFARTRATLDRAVVTPAYGYDYYYVMPKDFLRLVKGTVTDPSVYPVGLVPEELPVGADRELANKLSKYSWKFETIPLETGVEKVSNGTITGAATGWTLGTSWAYGTNNIVKTAHTAITTLSQAVGTMISAPVIGELYAVEFDLDAIAGGALIPSLGGATGDPVSTTGVKKQYLLASAITGDLTFTPTAMAVTCTIDAISVFKVEDRLVMLSDYEDDEDNPLRITYLRRVTDPTRYTADFINALAWRLAAELSTTLTESANKFQMCMEMYQRALQQADAIDSHMDFLTNEYGSNSWENAGR